MDPLIPAIVSTVIQTLMSMPSDPPPVAAISRQIPMEATKARMEPPAAGRIELNGETFALSPGVQIRDADNRIVMPMTVQRPATVLYLTDASGAVNRIWILGTSEAQRIDR